ncbi:hypothetical protein K7432_008449 [Basidiobolus ranarum]|uniref:Uncharacterized protein n=1 Tax=Basidiobolus ranarum TaxID=34480 RepID=A0ABR2VYK1_9FUNG
MSRNVLLLKPLSTYLHCIFPFILLKILLKHFDYFCTSSNGKSNGSVAENTAPLSASVIKTEHVDYTVNRKHPVRVYVVKTSIEYHDLVALFQVKNTEYQSLNEKIHAKKPQLEKLAEQVRKSSDSEKKELAVEITKLRYKEVSRWADEFTELHYDLEAIAKELWRASEQGLAD